jgi:hypothetical protein
MIYLALRNANFGLTSLYLAFAMGAKKSGYNLDRNMQEKITDGAREAYEKATG